MDLTPQTIAAELASGDKTRVEAAQQQLQALGYDVKPDGKLGSKTSAAVAKYRSDFTNQIRINRDTAVANQQANDPTNQLLKTATEVGPYVGGAVGGGVLGHVIGRSMNARDLAAREALDRIAANPEIAPKAALGQMGRLNRARASRTGVQFLGPAAAFGSAQFMRDVIAPKMPTDSAKEGINMAANVDQGVGAGMLLHQLVDLKNRIGSPYDPESEALIRSRMLPTEPNKALVEAMNGPQASLSRPTLPAAPQSPMRHAERLGSAASAAGVNPAKSKAANYNALRGALSEDNMKAVAKALDLPETTGRKAILQRARELLNTRGASSILAPLIAAGVAYDAATSNAKAGTEETTNVDRLKGATAAGTAGAAVYGGQKLINALSPAIKTAAGAGAEMAVPQMIDEMTNYSPEDLAMARNWAARNLPEWAQVGAIGEAGQMAQVPSPNPLRTGMANRVRRMEKGGASPQQIANWLNQNIQ